ncbi:MAG TPA: DEAD/DEAH box helicase, partial [Aliiroseovarius sp.]|nr:DEAD/DEAH box helicase [Aliiroseovarius sp.]
MSRDADLLKTVFGFDAFRPGQADIVTAVTNGENTLAIMPTGAGKSLCFQLPALLRDGVTVVISPLIALMR